MKLTFNEFYPLNEEEIKSIWEESIIVLDTNILLSWYRYSENTIIEYSKVLDGIKDKLWIPHQIAWEFQKQRINVIFQQVKVYSDFISKLSAIEAELNTKDRNPFLSPSTLNELSTALRNSKMDLETKKSQYESLVSNDTTLKYLSDLFDKKVGVEYSDEKITELKKTGDVRYEKKIPPGYKDSKKNNDEKYGDLFLWLQLLDKATEEKRPIIFVTEEQKEDWWIVKEGKTLGPRHELKKEFREKTGFKFHIYKPFSFLEYAYGFLDLTANDRAIKELKDIEPLTLNQVSTKMRITICYRKTKSTTSLQDFINLFLHYGYEPEIKEESDESGEINLIVPNILDLARRIKMKFISQIEDYGLELIDYKYQVITIN